MNEKCCKLLKEVINKNYSNVRLDKMSYNDEMFYYEFKSDEQVSENDLEKLEDDIKNLDKNIYVKLIRVSGVYYEGNANNLMITRIVGKGFDSQEEIDAAIDETVRELKRERAKLAIIQRRHE